MIIRVIKSKDNGEVLEDKTYKQYTEKEWTRKNYKLRRNAQGHVETWSRGHATFYTEDEALPLTERELKRYKAKQREQRKEARDRAKQRKQWELEELEKEYQEQLKTALQWL